MRGAIALGVLAVAAGCGGEGVAGSRDPSCGALACGKAPDGRRIEIRSSLDAAGPCLRIIGLPRGPRQCGRAPSEEIPPGPALRADAIVQITPRSRLELYGATRPEIRRVDVTFRHPSGCPDRRSAALIDVEDHAALREADISEAFGYFVAFVPSGARDVVAVGRDSSGAVVRRVNFDPIVDSLHPHNFIARELHSTSR